MGKEQLGTLTSQAKTPEKKTSSLIKGVHAFWVCALSVVIETDEGRGLGTVRVN